MSLALGLGRRGLGRVWPNPAVGCVIVKDGRVIGRGWTADGGRPHAEPQALSQAGPEARGATAYVTLEPCSHHGKTPPCADSLIAAGIARVVVACTDPDPRVSGRGIAALERAGISVTQSVLEAEARLDHAGFLSRVTLGRPFVTLKLALSLDGRIATGSGHSQWITGPQARRVVHMMRARHDAVMVGAGTVRADDPSLTVRGIGTQHQPVRVVVSRGLDLPQTGNLFTTARDVPVWLCHGPEAAARLTDWTAAGAVSVPCEVKHAEVSPASVLSALADRGITRVFCEGGGALAGSLLAEGLVDELAVFHAGLAIGAEGIPGIGALGLADLGHATRFDQIAVQSVGPDVLTIWRRRP